MRLESLRRPFAFSCSLTKPTKLAAAKPPLGAARRFPGWAEPRKIISKTEIKKAMQTYKILYILLIEFDYKKNYKLIQSFMNCYKNQTEAISVIESYMQVIQFLEY